MINTKVSTMEDEKNIRSFVHLINCISQYYAPSYLFTDENDFTNIGDDGTKPTKTPVPKEIDDLVKLAFMTQIERFIY